MSLSGTITPSDRPFRFAVERWPAACALSSGEASGCRSRSDRTRSDRCCSPTRGAARARSADGVVHCLVVQRNFILPEQVLAVLPAALGMGAAGDRVACPTIVHGEGNRFFAHPHPPLMAGGWHPAASRANLQAVRRPRFEAKLQDVVAVLEKMRARRCETVRRRQAPEAGPGTHAD